MGRYGAVKTFADLGDPVAPFASFLCGGRSWNLSSADLLPDPAGRGVLGR
ncbi:hypothetical protein ACRAWD_20200 [Caulobacter segnis]